MRTNSDRLAGMDRLRRGRHWPSACRRDAGGLGPSRTVVRRAARRCRGRTTAGETGGGKRAARGFAMAAVLICLLVVMTLSAALLQAVVQQHRWMRSSHQQLQAAWLADSAVQRAVFQLGQSPRYVGEQWLIPAEVVGQDARVSIDVAPSSDGTAGRSVRIAASYPDHASQRTLSERELRVPVSEEE
jgi:Tfp pilus assembly protein PilV